MLGALLIDKPSGPTSHDVVAFVRRTLETSRVGHTGTLDPLATGLLVVLVGAATRLAQFLSADEKEYLADVRLGVATPTYDAASLSHAPSWPGGASSDAAPDAGRGGPVDRTRGTPPAGADIEAVLQRFRGTFLQTPPPFSAKKIASVPAYEKARKQQPVALTPVEVTVRTLEVVPSSTGDPGLLRLIVVATAGFYVRSLAHDIGQLLGCGAHLEALRRVRAGRFSVDDALTLDRLEARGADALVPPSVLLSEMPAVTLTDAGAVRAAHGNAVGPGGIGDPGVGLAGTSAGGRVRLVDGSGGLVAVAERRPNGLLQPVVVLR